MNDKHLFIPKMCELLIEVEKETHKELGDDAGFFANVWDDCLTINQAITDAYPEEKPNLVGHFFRGLIKELYWFHFFFVTGNYVIINARMRFVWEAIYRAYFAETYEGVDPPGPSPDDKLHWLEKRKPTWTDLQPILHKLFPLAASEKEVGEYYRALWKKLHLFVHPSAEVTFRAIDESALHSRDGFDKNWALDTIAVGKEVFDVIWVAVVSFYPRAADRLAQSGLCVKYTIVTDVLRRMRGG